jgi:hypothetical protein
MLVNNKISKRKSTSRRKGLFWLKVSEVSVYGHWIPLFLGM